jgi:hypothetical protein
VDGGAGNFQDAANQIRERQDDFQLQKIDSRYKLPDAATHICRQRLRTIPRVTLGVEEESQADESA